MTILHASDLHFGKPHLPEVSEAILRLVAEKDPVATVISGDLTQRAKPREYRAAQRFLEKLAPRPVVVTAGNHDVPLYRVWERLLAPYRQYRRHLGDRLDSILDVGGAGNADHSTDPERTRLAAGETAGGGVRFVALNSSAPHSAIVNGRLSDGQLNFAAKAFAATPARNLRVLVVHHNLLRPPTDETVHLLPRASRVLRMVEGWGVDLVLSGHLHQSHLGWSRDPASGNGGGQAKADREACGEGVAVVAAGTASSNRGRGRERGRNSLNFVRVRESTLEVMVYLYSEQSGRFVPSESRRYPRRAR